MQINGNHKFMIKEELRKLIHKNSWKPDWSKWDQNELMSNSTFHDILKWLDFHDFIVIFDESCKLRQVGIFDESVFSMHWHLWWIGIFDESKFSANRFQRRYSLIQGNRKTFSLFFGYIHFFQIAEHLDCKFNAFRTRFECRRFFSYE